VDESEFIAPPCTVEERNREIGLTPEHMVEHRSEWRDTGASRDQQHARVRFQRWQDERANRTFDVDERTGHCRAKVHAESAVALNRNQ
jgi:hypothetical protein